VTLYRLIFLSHEHKITATTKVRCETDEQAIAEARNTADGRGVVILQDNRCVDAIEGSGNQPRDNGMMAVGDAGLGSHHINTNQARVRCALSPAQAAARPSPTSGSRPVT
jgi:hypothetical protein